MAFINGMMFSSFVVTIGITIIRIMLKFTLGADLPYEFENNTPLSSSYDFIVVGAGAGGSVVASRLSETGATVLLLEAGKSQSPEAAIPGLLSALYGGDRDWHFKGKPSKVNQLGYTGNSSYMFLGKMMSGSTGLNGMVYTRGNKKDFNLWSDLGNSGWDYESVLPYFKKSEDYKGFKFPNSAEFHGKGGPLSVEKRSFVTKVTPAIFGAAKELGYKVIDDSGPTQIGFTPVQLTTKNRIRSSAAESFLRPVVGRKNLVIKPSSVVRKVLFNSANEAIGVEYVSERTNKVHRVRAKREVILCAGGLQSPKILMLSGVGPKEHLQKFKIPVVADIKGVGQNFNDHPTFYLNYIVNKGTAINAFDILDLRIVKNLLKDRTGLLSSAGGIEVHSFFNLRGDDPDWADVQIFFTSSSYGVELGFTIASALGIKKEVFKDIYGPILGKDTISMSITLSRPRSTGSVTLQSADYRQQPVIDFNFFGDEDDLKLMVKAVRFTQKVLNTTSVQETLGASYPNNILRYCRHFGIDTDAYWSCYIRYMVNTYWHYSGTCKMAPDSDSMGVVDDRLRVRGVKKLRVVDASIMPQVVSTNTQAATYMIGEKAADMIKEDWGYSVDPLPT